MSTPSPVTIKTVRDELALLLRQSGVPAYAYPPSTVSPPAIVIVPDEPYIDVELIGSNGTNVVLKFELIVAVQAIDNPGQLDLIERLAVQVMQLLPKGTVLDAISRPTIETVGPSDLLTVRIPIQLRRTLTVTE